MPRRCVVVRGIAAVFCVLALGAPVAAQGSISEEQELEIGRLAAGELISEYGVVADPDWLGFLGQVRDCLLPFSGRPSIPYRMMVLDTPIVNAVSTPGYVFVTRGMLRLGLDAPGWAFVIGHEMAHTAKRHLAAEIERANAGAVLALVVAVLTGNRTAVDLLRLVMDISMLGYARDKETEADIESLRMMVEAGFDPAKAAQTMAFFDEATGHHEEHTHWAGTHPGWVERIAAINTAYAAFPSRGLPLRVWYFEEPKESDGLTVAPMKLEEGADGWVLTLALENATDAEGTVFAEQAVLTGPDGELAARFLRSTLPGEIAAKGKISGMLAFEKRTSHPPTALLLPVLFPDRRVDLQLPLTSGGPYTPARSPASLPAPPPMP